MFSVFSVTLKSSSTRNARFASPSPSQSVMVLPRCRPGARWQPGQLVVRSGPIRPRPCNAPWCPAASASRRVTVLVLPMNLCLMLLCSAIRRPKSPRRGERATALWHEKGASARPCWLDRPFDRRPGPAPVPPRSPGSAVQERERAVPALGPGLAPDP